MDRVGFLPLRLKTGFVTIRGNVEESEMDRKINDSNTMELNAKYWAMRPGMTTKPEPKEASVFFNIADDGSSVTVTWDFIPEGDHESWNMMVLELVK